jgi:hypothetical protein
MIAKGTKMAKAEPTPRHEKSKPAFPYTTIPGALRIFLKEVPEKPKPPKFSQQVMRSCGINSNNYATILSVLRSLELLDTSNQPTPDYVRFMNADSGPLVLGEKIRKVYAKLFESSREPFREADQRLKNLFNIHSGGAEETLKLQIATFKALCEFAKFDVLPPAITKDGDVGAPRAETGGSGHSDSPIALHIDLHIHL